MEIAELEQRAWAFRREALADSTVTKLIRDDFWETLMEHGLPSLNALSPQDTLRYEGYPRVHVSWREHQPALDQHEAFLLEYARIIARLSELVTSYANELTTLLTELGYARHPLRR